MENILNPGPAATLALAPAPSSTPTAILAAAKQARDAYEDALTSDGVTAGAWRSIAAAMHQAAAALQPLLGNPAAPYLMPSSIQCLADRATDADQRADYAHRMVKVAAASRRQIVPAILVIEVA